MGIKFDEIEHLLQEIKGLPVEVLREKNEDVKKMIEYFDGLTAVIEDRRNKVYENSLTIISIIVAAITIMFMNLIWSPYIIIPLVFLLTFLISMFVVVAKFYSQNKSNYVFKDSSLVKYSNKWKWFYYGNTNILKINTFVNNTDSVSTYIDGLKFFLTKYKDENIQSEITDNLQQLYLLQVHNYYKNQYYLNLVKTQRVGLYFALCLTALAAIILVL